MISGEENYRRGETAVIIGELVMTPGAGDVISVISPFWLSRHSTAPITTHTMSSRYGYSALR